jgi:hypothetical protein
MNDEFYIGWEDKAPSAIGKRVRHAVVILLILAVALGVVLSLAQRTIGVSVFEWGEVKSFSGIFKSQPYPHLLVPRPGVSSGQTPFSSYYLVKPFKFGLDSETAARLDGEPVSLKGTLIYRGGQTMIEVADPRFSRWTLQHFNASTLQRCPSGSACRRSSARSWTANVTSV